MPLAATVRWPRTPSVQKQKSRSGSSDAEFDRLALERLRDDRAGDVARVLARPVVVEHPRHDAGHAERVVVVHRQEVRRDLRRRVDRLRVDRRALVQDQAAVRVEVVVMRDRFVDVAVLLRRPRGVELLQLEAVVDDRLQQVERPDACSPSRSRTAGATTRRRAPARRGGRRTACPAPSRSSRIR